MKSEDIAFIAGVTEDECALCANGGIWLDDIDGTGDHVVAPVVSDFDEIKRRRIKRTDARAMKQAIANEEFGRTAMPVRAENGSGEGIRPGGSRGVCMVRNVRTCDREIFEQNFIGILNCEAD